MDYIDREQDYYLTTASTSMGWATSSGHIVKIARDAQEYKQEHPELFYGTWSTDVASFIAVPRQIPLVRDGGWIEF